MAHLVWMANAAWTSVQRHCLTDVSGRFDGLHRWLISGVLQVPSSGSWSDRSEAYGPPSSARSRYAGRRVDRE